MGSNQLCKPFMAAWHIRYPLAVLVLFSCLWVGGKNFPAHLFDNSLLIQFTRYGLVVVGLLWVLILAKELIFLILALVFLYWVVGGWSSFFKEGEWEGIVYPNADDLTFYQNVGVFPSLTECRLTAIRKLYELKIEDKGDYECGLNCRFENGSGSLRTCEKTTE